MADIQDVEIRVTANTTQARTELEKLKGAGVGAGEGIGKVGGSAANASPAMVSLGRIVQDMPFGFIGIANNVTMLTEQFMVLRVSAGSTTAALTAMKASLWGPMGVIMVVSIATTALQYFALASQGAKKAVNEVEGALKKVLDLKNPLEGYKNNMGTVELKNMLFSEKNILKQNEKELSKLKRAGYGFSATDYYAWQSGAKTSSGDELRAIEERIKKLTVENEASAIFIKTIEAELKAYEKLDAASKVLDRYFKRDNGSEKITDDQKIPDLKDQKNRLKEQKTFLELFKEDVLTQIEIDNLLNLRTKRSVYESYLKTIQDQIAGDKLSKSELLEWLKLRKQVNDEFIADHSVDIMGFTGPLFKMTDKLGKQWSRLLAQQLKQQERERMQAEKAAAKQQYQIYEDLFIKPFTNTFRGEFSKAWNSIFGEATSLFEKFMQGVAEQLFNFTVQKAAFGLLGMIPGVGPILELAGAGKPVVNQIIMDGELIATQKQATRNKAILDRQAALK